MKLQRDARRWFKDTGVIEKGKWDNLPGGEIFTTPDEEKVNGILMLPALQDEISKNQGVDEYVKLTIKNGKIANIDGEASAEKMRKYLQDNSINEINPESVLQCSEIAFGANSKAKSIVTNPDGQWFDIGRSTTETEKQLGTIHIAFGSAKHGETGTEGHTSSNVHLDFVIPKQGLTVEKFINESDFKNLKKLSKTYRQRWLEYDLTLIKQTLDKRISV